MRQRFRRGSRPKLAEMRLDQATVLAPILRHRGAHHARLEGVHVCGVVQHFSSHSGSHDSTHVVKRESTYRFCPPVRPLGCETRHVRSNSLQLLAAMEHVVCFCVHAAWEQVAECVVVFSEQRVKERKKFQFGVAVGQDVQGAREEEEACDVLAQGVEASQDHITHQRQRGHQRQNIGRRSFDGGTRIVCDVLLKRARAQFAVALGQYYFGVTKAVIVAKVTPACSTTRTN